MKYLLTYSAEVDGGNGAYNEDFKELYDKIEDIYEEIAYLESKEGDDFLLKFLNYMNLILVQLKIMKFI